MKLLLKITIFSIFALFLQSAFAQNPPDAVHKSFQQMFPTAKRVKWEQEKSKVWVAEMKKDGRDLEALFRTDGTFIGTEQEVSKDALPAAVKSHVQSARLEEVDQYKLMGGAVIYEVAGVRNGTKFEEYYFENGDPTSSPE